MPCYDLYGTMLQELATVRSEIEIVLQIVFRPHQSDWRSGDYWRSGELGQENFILQSNRSDDEPAELEFAEFPTLLYVSNTERSDAIRSALARCTTPFVRLKHEAF